MTQEALRIGIAGLGTVGCGALSLLERNAALITARAGRKIDVRSVSSRDRSKKRPVNLSAYEWCDDPLEMVKQDDIDVIVELIGGEDGVAKDLCEQALACGKHVVTANKAMLAHHGYDLAKAAELSNVQLMYEAAVAGAIPVVKALREGFAGNAIQAVYGILNGTCNYILTEMRETGRDFDDVLAEAQEKGYTEADPTFDVDGIDAAHKLCILSSLAFGVKPDFEALKITGIRNITSGDIAYAEELGYRIKLLGATCSDQSGISQSVEPCLVREDSTIGSVEGVFNTVLIEADAIDSGQLIGRGAGAEPTASAVIADLIDIARGAKTPTFGLPHDALVTLKCADYGTKTSRFYVRLVVRDQVGVLAAVSSILSDHKVSVEALMQQGRDPNNPVSIVLTTHEVSRADIDAALADIKKLDAILSEPSLLRIEDF